VDSLIKDVYKTDVFRLAQRLNERAVGADPALDHRSCAECRSCAPTSSTRTRCRRTQLDRVLEAYVELDRSREELSQDGFDRDVVERALARRPSRVQAPPGAAGREAPAEGRSARPAHADHEPLEQLTGYLTSWASATPSNGTAIVNP
jgi:hypothetical protein